YFYDTALGQRVTTICAVGVDNGSGTCVGGTPNQVLQSETSPFVERFLGNSPKPRVSIGVGVNWNSPFGPLRIDLAKALVKQEGDD
ncbi:BamA/TamA family outer membrane protein, partial [Klebsiella pneumoniae]|nr:BamA/TamA family outer membrane protein [Klebsiella pneumoniae]